MLQIKVKQIILIFKVYNLYPTAYQNKIKSCFLQIKSSKVIIVSSYQEKHKMFTCKTITTVLLKRN